MNSLFSSFLSTRGWTFLFWAALWSVFSMPSTAWSHSSRINSFSISPTSNVSPGARISFSGSVYGYHVGHSYTGYTRIYRGNRVSGSALYSRSFSYPNSSAGRTYSISGSLTASSTPGTHYFILNHCVTNTSTCTSSDQPCSGATRPGTPLSIPEHRS